MIPARVGRVRSTRSAAWDADLRICFVSDIYPIVEPAVGGCFGGAEIQQLKLARAIQQADPGVEITFLVRDYGQSDPVDYGGMSLRRLYPPPQPRFPAWIHVLRRVMRQVDADIYYQRCAGTVTGVVSQFCRRAGKRFVHALANDRDVDGTFLAESPWWRRRSYRSGLERADLVIAQSEHQQRLLEANHGRTGLVLKSLAAPLEVEASEVPGLEGPYITWVGTLDERKKRPSLFLDLAASMPDHSFLLVGRKAGEADHAAVLRRVAQLGHVQLIEGLPATSMDAVYRASRAVVCTARHEGFPNVLLEAWSHGCPVATLFDPDDVVRNHGLGVSCDELETLREGLICVLDGPSCKPQIRDYLRRHHDPSVISEACLCAMRELL